MKFEEYKAVLDAIDKAIREKQNTIPNEELKELLDARTKFILAFAKQTEWSKP